MPAADKPMKILLLGKNGQVGWELQRSLAPLGELIALDRASNPYCGDLSRPAAVAQSVLEIKPDVVVNAAAYTAVDKAESEADSARTVNADAPAELARAAKLCGAWLLHYSTDYVFDGSGSVPWREQDPVAPLNVYGRSKLAGEQAIRASGCRHLIFRTSWVYAARGQNFAKTMLRLAAEREELSVIADQFGAPTGAELLADVSAHALRHAVCHNDVSGVYHLTAGGATSWFDYAAHVFAYARQCGIPLKLTETGLRPISTEQYPTPARRPLNSRLDTNKLRTAFGLALPDWQSGVDRMLTELYGR